MEIVMLPLIVYEDAVRLFSFYYEGYVHQGISHEQKLYRLIHCTGIDSRLEAYEAGLRLSNQGIKILITVSDRCYRVWAEIRSSFQSMHPQNSSQNNRSQSSYFQNNFRNSPTSYLN